jgi:hypothetical protein
MEVISEKKKTRTIQEGGEKTATLDQEKENSVKIFAKRRNDDRVRLHKEPRCSDSRSKSNDCADKATNAFIDENVISCILLLKRFGVRAASSLQLIIHLVGFLRYPTVQSPPTFRLNRGRQRAQQEEARPKT